jgi:hypothetical protein
MLGNGGKTLSEFSDIRTSILNRLHACRTIRVGFNQLFFAHVVGICLGYERLGFTSL